MGEHVLLSRVEGRQGQLGNQLGVNLHRLTDDGGVGEHEDLPAILEVAAQVEVESKV